MDGIPAPAGHGAGTVSAITPQECGVRSLDTVRSLIDRMRSRFAEPLELKQIARESGLNANYLSTVFAREAGIPFKAYLTALRLECAQALLCDSRLRISRIASKVGYVSPHRFRAAFRARTGLSPGRWRTARITESER